MNSVPGRSSGQEGGSAIVPLSSLGIARTRDRVNAISLDHDQQILRLHRIPNLHLYSVIQALLLGMSIFMMVKASHDEAYPLPLFGELAQKSVAED